MYEILEKRLESFITDRKWNAFQTPKNLCMALYVESTELAEHFVWISELASIQAMQDVALKSEVIDEMGDVFNTMILFAKSLDLNLLKLGMERVQHHSNQPEEMTVLFESLPSLSEIITRSRIMANLTALSPDKTPKNLIMSLVVEAGKLSDHFNWKTDYEALLLKSNEEMHTSLGDLFYTFLLIANRFEIDPVQAGIEKVSKAEKKYPVDRVKDSLDGYLQCKKEFRQNS